MNKKKKIFTALCVLVGALFVAGVTAIATTNYGTADDPLITLSYLNQTVKPALEDELEKSVDSAKKEISDEFKKQIAGFESSIESRLAGGTVSPGTSVTSGEFKVVTLTNRQVLICGVGSELLLRTGDATAYGGGSPRLVDSTDGTEISAAGGPLAKNHMYMVPADGHGIRAASDSVTVLVCGSYEVHSDL